jgi:hypothetical protein
MERVAEVLVAEVGGGETKRRDCFALSTPAMGTKEKGKHQRTCTGLCRQREMPHRSALPFTAKSAKQASSLETALRLITLK